MNTTKKHHQKNNRPLTQQRRGFTLTEVVVTIAILSVVSLGVINYQFHAIRRTKLANSKMAAARIGLLILENWKNVGGSSSFDPTTLDIGIIDIEEGDDMYQLIVDNVPFYFNFSSQEIDANATTGVTLCQLQVSVQWRSDGQQQLPISSDPSSTFYTYVRQDQSGG